MGSVFRQQGRKVWKIQYYRHGKQIVESSHTENKTEAKRTLRDRETAIDKGLPITAEIARFNFAAAAKNIKRDYSINGRRSLPELERRIRLHLEPFFGHFRMASITMMDVREYIDERKKKSASNAELNRELAVLKRMFSLAIEGGQLLYGPKIKMLDERNVRTGFFEQSQFEAVREHLPEDLRHVVTFAYITGWRVPSEVLPLQWRRVDLDAGTVRLDPGTTKNDAGRLFPFDVMPDLKHALEAQRERTDAWEHEHGAICPWVFHLDGRSLLDKGGRAGKEFRDAWRAACRAAGCPGRIPHDFRRTAVRNLVRNSVPEKTAMLLTGHKTRSVFDRYDIVNEADLRQAVERLAAGSARREEQATARRRGHPGFKP